MPDEKSNSGDRSQMTDPTVPGDPGEANRGIGQENLTRDEPRGPDGPGPAAGGPGTGDGPSVREPKHQQPMKDLPSVGNPKGTYGQG